MTKLIKTLIIINGLLVPAFLGLVGYSFIKSQFQNDYDEEPGGIMVGEHVEEAKQDSLILQGIVVGSPTTIANSANFYLMVTVGTWEEPRYVGVGDPEPVSLREAYYDDYDCINILFLDKDYKALGKLLEKNGSITEIHPPNDDDFLYRNHFDTTVKYMSYQIGFEDTDGDGLINHKDARDLYISNLDGTNLTQVTKGLDVNYSRFVKSGKKMFICYKSDEEHPDEYKHSKFALYDIKLGKLELLTDIDDTLKSIEHDLIK